MINGKVTNFAQLAFDKGMKVVLPGNSELLQSGSKDEKDEKDIEIDASAFDINGKLSIDQLLNKDIKKQDKESTKNKSSAAP